MGWVREVTAEVEGGSFSLIKVLMRGGTSGASFLVRDLVAVVCNIEKLKGVHVGGLWNVPEKKFRRQKAGSTHRAAQKSMLQEARTQLLQTYIDRRQATVAE